MSAASFFKSRGFTSVAGRTYPGTFAVVRRDSFLAEQVANRDSATWKKAEHIVIEECQSDLGSSVIAGWKALTAAEPTGLSIQKLYVFIGEGRYAMYDANGNGPVIDTLTNLVH